MATVTITVPILAQTGLPHGSPGTPTLETVVITPTLRRNGYYFYGKVIIKGHNHTIKLDVTMRGDQMSGTLIATRGSDLKVINNVLRPVTCAFPGVPHAASWDKIRFAGLNDYATLAIDSGSLALPAGARSKSVVVKTGIIVIDKAAVGMVSGKPVEDVSRDIPLTGNDRDGWSLPNNISKFTAIIPNNYERDVYGKVITLFIDFDSLNVIIGNAAVRYSGSFKSSYDIDGVVSSPITVDFASEFSSTTYNSKFPWVSAFTVINSKNLDVSLIASDSFLPPLPPQYKVIIMAYITGTGP